MNPFKTYTYKWWQIGIFKFALLAIGILIGSYFAQFFQTYTTLVITIAVITSSYIMYISLKQ